MCVCVCVCVYIYIPIGPYSLKSSAQLKLDQKVYTQVSYR